MQLGKRACFRTRCKHPLHVCPLFRFPGLDVYILPVPFLNIDNYLSLLNELTVSQSRGKLSFLKRGCRFSQQLALVAMEPVPQMGRSVSYKSCVCIFKRLHYWSHPGGDLRSFWFLFSCKLNKNPQETQRLVLVASGNRCEEQAEDQYCPNFPDCLFASLPRFLIELFLLFLVPPYSHCH